MMLIPDFSAYRVVILVYNGDRWSASTERRFLDYVRDGGGWCSTTPPTMLFPIGRNCRIAARRLGRPRRAFRPVPVLEGRKFGKRHDEGARRLARRTARILDEWPYCRTSGCPGIARAVDTCDRRAVRSDARSGQCRGIAVHGLCRSRTRRFRTRGTVGFYRRWKARIFHLMIGHARTESRRQSGHAVHGVSKRCCCAVGMGTTGKVRHGYPTSRRSGKAVCVRIIGSLECLLYGLFTR